MGLAGRLSRFGRPRTRPDLAAGAAAAALVLVLEGLILRVWRADLGIPFVNDGDALFNTAVVKGLIDNGWWTRNPNLGYPHGLDMQDFPLGGDNLQLALLWVIGHITGDAGTTVNVFFLLALPLSAVTAFAVLRWLGTTRPVAMAVAVLFALSPYALLRGEVHLFLVAWPVPIGVWLALRVWRGDRLFDGWRTRTTFITVAALIVVGSTGAYYFPFFTGVLIAVATLARLLAGGGRRAVTAGGTLIAGLLLVLLLNSAPTIVYALQNGQNEVVGVRRAPESEFYGLKLAQLVLPIAEHRVGPLADLHDEYASTAVPSAGAVAEVYWSALGVVATVGFVALLVVGIRSLAGARRDIDDRLRILSLFALCALGVATVGGGSALFAYLVSPQLRAWNRLSVFIAFCCLAAVALLLDRLTNRLRTHRRGGLLVGGLLVAVVSVGVLDQTTSAMVPDYKALRGLWKGDERFVADIESRLPAGSAVLQVPPVAFPESPPTVDLYDYAVLRGYLHSNELDWSYAAMKGRPADWARSLAQRPPGEVFAASAAVGFDGIWIERKGYPDYGRSLEEAAARTFSQEPLVDEGEHLSFFDMREYAAELEQERGSGWMQEARRLTLAPVTASVPEDQTAVLDRGLGAWAVLTAETTMTLSNPLDEVRSVILRLRTASTTPQPTTVRVRLPDGSEAELDPGDDSKVAVKIDVPAGESEVVLTTPPEPPPQLAAGVPRVRYHLYAAVTDALLAD